MIRVGVYRHWTLAVSCLGPKDLAKESDTEPAQRSALRWVGRLQRSSFFSAVESGKTMFVLKNDIPTRRIKS